eukprot:scaffold74493_cov19-Tisochrysis_lutea.AAC.1
MPLLFHQPKLKLHLHRIGLALASLTPERIQNYAVYWLSCGAPSKGQRAEYRTSWRRQGLQLPPSFLLSRCWCRPLSTSNKLRTRARA